MTRTARDSRRSSGPVAGLARLRSAPRRRRLGAAGVVVILAITVGVVALLGRSGSPSLAGSPVLPSAYRPGIGIAPITLGESRSGVLAALGRHGKQVVPGTLLFPRASGQIAVVFAGGRATRILATGAGDPFGQRLAAEETTLSSWDIELCEKPARVLLVAPGGHTYFVFRSAAAGLGAVGVSISPVQACGLLG